MKNLKKIKNNNKKKLLIIGRIPPPIGGISIHLERIIPKLKKDNITFHFHQYPKKSKFYKLFYTFILILKYDIIHIHTTNKILSFILCFFSFLIRKKTLYTFHLKYNFSNFLDRIILKMSIIAIVMNKYTFNNAKKISKNILFISPFTPATKIKPLDKKIITKIDALKSKYKYIFCSNATLYEMTKGNKERYGVTQLINLFKEIPDSALITINNPTKKYKKIIISKCGEIPSNIYVVYKEIDFISLLKKCDCVIRATTIDGDALTIKEAIHYGKNVIASDCVDRPKECILYETNNWEELKNKILSFQPKPINNKIEDGYIKLRELYKSLIEN